MNEELLQTQILAAHREVDERVMRLLDQRIEPAVILVGEMAYRLLCVSPSGEFGLPDKLHGVPVVPNPHGPPFCIHVVPLASEALKRKVDL